MKVFSFNQVFAMAPVAALLLASCASKPENEKNVSSAFRQGVPGGAWVESFKTAVAVVAIDPASRKVKLVASDMSRNTFTAGSNFKNFDQLRVGDQFQAAVARELIVFVRGQGMPPAADTTAAKELIKAGKQSGALKSDPEEKNAKVTAIYPNQGQATLQFADGTTKDIQVRRDVNLWKFNIGEEVVLRTRSVVVLNLAKP